MDHKTVKALWVGIGVHCPVSEGNEQFHEGLLKKLHGAMALANQRMKKIDPDLRASVKAGRQAEILQGLRARLKAEAEFAARPHRDRMNQLLAERESKIHPPTPEDPVQALRQEIKLNALRAELLAIPEGAERHQAVMDAARRGVPGLLNVLEGGLRPLLPDALAGQVRDIYAQTVCPPELTKAITLTEAVLDECDRAAFLVQRAFATGMFRLDPSILPDWQSITHAQLAQSWTEERKIQFAAAHGDQAYRDLMGRGTGYEFPPDNEPIPTVVG